MTGMGTRAEASLVPFADRVRYTHMVRAVMATVVALAWFAGAAPGARSGAAVGLLTAAYLLVTSPTLLASRMSRSAGITLFGAALLLDGVYLAGMGYAVGGFAAPLVVLVPVHAVATTLLGSFRTGLKLALWHSLLIGAVLEMQQDGFLSVVPRPDATLAIALVAGVWLVTLVTANSGAANERELRRRNYDLLALARLGLAMEQTTDPDKIAHALVAAVQSEFPVDGVALAAAATGEPELLAALGTSPQTESPRPAGDALVAETMSRGVTARIASPDPRSNPWLMTIMPAARHLVLVPLHAEGRSLGVLVFAYKAGTSSRIERRIVQMVEQFVAHGALELQNAWLLARIGALASTDGLTGIANRRSFDLALKRELERAAAVGGPLSLLLLDIDHFKRHNDVFGHQVGDRTLGAVAQVLAKNARQSDVAARYGGEEFAVILPGAGTDMAVEKAERVRALVAALPDPTVTVSVGVATYPFHGGSAGDLITAADNALYASKRGGRDQVTAAEVTDAANPRLLREVS